MGKTLNGKPAYIRIEPGSHIDTGKTMYSIYFPDGETANVGDVVWLEELGTRRIVQVYEDKEPTQYRVSDPIQD